MTLINELRKQVEYLRERLSSCEAENQKLREDVRRWENANCILSLENKHYKEKLFGPNTHPAAVAHYEECKRKLEQLAADAKVYVRSDA